jgi:adhesin transport system outer membrane protein
MQVQSAQQQVAEQDLQGARLQFLPTPAIAVEKARVSDSDIAYAGDSTVSTLSLQQPLWSGGRLLAGVHKAKADVRSNRAAVEEARLQLAIQVVQTYGDFFAAQLKADAQQKSLATHQRLQTQVQRRIEQGASADSDLTLAMTRLNSVASDNAVSQAQRDIAVIKLTQLLGQPLTADALGMLVVAPRPLNADIAAMLLQAQSLNPSVQKLQAQADAQTSVIAERRANLSPEIYMRAERQYGNFADSNTESENRLLLGLSSQFGAGFSSISTIKSAKWQRQAALAQVEEQKLAVSEQVLADYALATSLTQRLSQLSDSLTAAGQVSASYDRQFLAGRKTWIDVMNAARERAQIEIQLAELRASLLVASWRLAMVTQGVNVVISDQK